MLRLILSLLLVQQIAAFAPRSTTFSPAVTVQGARPPMGTMMKTSMVLRMSEEGGRSTEPEATPAETPTISADGTFYDDELDSAPIKQGISDSMRERLIREASTGLDAEQKQTNVILYISIGVAILVLLGGQGILY